MANQKAMATLILLIAGVFSECVRLEILEYAKNPWKNEIVLYV
jgi:hypothetical protein